MNPKEKAAQLYLSMLAEQDGPTEESDKDRAKQCALTAVDAMNGVNVAVSFEFVDYWKEVKTEIEKL